MSNQITPYIGQITTSFNKLENYQIKDWIY